MSTTPPKKEGNTNSEAKQTNVLGNKESLKKGKTENVGDNTKEKDSENSKKKLKDISNADKETYGQTLNNWLQ